MDPHQLSINTPGVAIGIAAAATGLLAAIFWIWLGRARGSLKRIAYRALLFTLAAALVAAGRTQGLFARASIPFDLALAVIILLVVFGNLYAVRFCTACGRMHRNFKASVCARCGQPLPRHGFTEEPRRAPLNPIDPLGRKRSRAQDSGPGR
jgi:hypothetical protein